MSIRSWSGLAAAILACTLMTVSCARDQKDPDPAGLQTLSSNTVAAVSVGPATVENIKAGDTSNVYTFDMSGKLLGELSGPAIYANSISSTATKLISTSSDHVIVTTNADQVIHDIGFENIVQASSADPESGTAIFWYNTGMDSGTYVNRYAFIDDANAIHTGEVGGLARTVAQCGPIAYTVIQRIETEPGRPSTRSSLYRTDSMDAAPIVDWEFPADYKPISRTSACDAKTGTMFALYSTDAAATSNGAAGMTLVEIDIANGSRVERPLTVPTQSSGVVAGTLSLVDGRLYWVDADRNVLSVSISDNTDTVRLDWRIGVEARGSAVSVSGDLLSVVGRTPSMTYSRYELGTGASVGPTVELPWLDPRVDESSTSALVDVASFDQ